MKHQLLSWQVAVFLIDWLADNAPETGGLGFLPETYAGTFEESPPLHAFIRSLEAEDFHDAVKTILEEEKDPATVHPHYLALALGERYAGIEPFAELLTIKLEQQLYVFNQMAQLRKYPLFAKQLAAYLMVKAQALHIQLGVRSDSPRHRAYYRYDKESLASFFIDLKGDPLFAYKLLDAVTKANPLSQELFDDHVAQRVISAVTLVFPQLQTAEDLLRSLRLFVDTLYTSNKSKSLQYA